jgi:hypothetical protein
VKAGNKQSVLCFFDHEDGGDMFLRNLGSLATDYTALYHRRQYSSNVSQFGEEHAI